jgi:hypothetical protein
MAFLYAQTDAVLYSGLADADGRIRRGNRQSKQRLALQPLPHRFAGYFTALLTTGDRVLTLPALSSATIEK